MYVIRGYAFIDGEHHRFVDGRLFVRNWDEAHELLKNNGYEHYMITLDEVPEDKEE